MDANTLVRFEEFVGGARTVDSVGAIVRGPITTQTGTTYTYALTDADSYVRHNNASPITATVPPQSTVAFALGTVITVEQRGAGLLTIAAGSGVTINSQTTLKMGGQWAVACLVYVGTNEWTLSGNLATS